MGLFHPFLDDRTVEIYGVEAAGHGLGSGCTPPRSPAAAPACCTATAPTSCMDDDGQITEAHSISAGLDYPGIGPEHSWLHDVGRVHYVSATDEEALEAFQLAAKLEGIIPALEPAHALAKVMELAPTKPKDHLMVMNLCGRGDKDIFTVAEHLGSDAVTTRIEDRVSPRWPREGRAGLVTFVTAGDPDYATSLAILEACRRPAPTSSSSACRSPIRWPTGRRSRRPALRALKAGQTMAQDAGAGARVPQADDRTTPVILMGYYNPIYIYGVERFLADAKAGRRRRPDRRRPAARGGRRAVPAGARGRA